MATWVLSGVNMDAYLSATSGQGVPDIVGGERPSFGGGLRTDVAALKRTWAATTVPSLGEVAEGIRRMVDGLVDAWSFEADTYSARGLVLSASSGAVVGTTAPKHGGKGLQDGGNRLAYAEWAGALPAGAPWTLMLWRADGPYASPQHRHWIRTSAGGLWVEGVAAASPPACAEVDAAGKLIIRGRDKQENLGTWASATTFLGGTRISVVVGGTVYIFQSGGGISGGSPPSWPTTYNATVVDNTITWRNDGRGGLLADDAVLLPFVAPSSWISQLYAEHAARAWVAPHLRMTGDAASTAGNAVLVRGVETSARGALHKRSGATQRTGKVVQFRLLEVERE